MARAKSKYKLRKAVEKESADIGKAYGKRNLWSKVGMGLGGALAIGLTGGAAAPLVAAAMAGGGTFLGGKLGDIAARQTGAKIKGKGKFLKGTREGTVKRIGEDILAGSIKAGVGAGFTQLGGLKGLSQLKEKGGVAGLFKGGDAVAGQKGLGKLIDFKGSAIGKGLEKYKTNLVESQFQKAQEGLPRAFGDLKDPSEWTESALAAKSQAAGRSALGRAPSHEQIMSGPAGGPGFEKGFTPGHSKVQFDVAQEKFKNYQFGPGSKVIAGGDVTSPSEMGKTQWEAFKSSEPVMDIEKISATPDIQYEAPGVKGKLQRFLPGGKSGYQEGIPTGPGLSAEEIDIKDYHERMGMDRSTYVSDKMPLSTELQDVTVDGNFYESSNIKHTPQYVAGKHAEASDISQLLNRDAPIQPKVPVATDDVFSLADKPVDVVDTDFSRFDQGSWAEGREELSRIGAKSNQEVQDTLENRFNLQMQERLDTESRVSEELRGFKQKQMQDRMNLDLAEVGAMNKAKPSFQTDITELLDKGDLSIKDKIQIETMKRYENRPDYGLSAASRYMREVPSIPRNWNKSGMEF